MLTPLCATDIVDSPEGTDKQPILTPLLSDSSLALLYGPRGIGKSFTALGIAWAVAAGCEFLKWRAIKPCRVLYIDGELASSDLRQRLAALGPPPQRLHFLAASMLGCALPALRGDSGYERAWEPRVDDDRHPDLLVVDSLSSVIGDGSHATARWAEARRWLLRMCEMGIAVLLVHHGTKRGAPRGPSHREDVFDLVMSLKRPTDYRPREGLRVELHFEKARGLFGPDVDPFEARMSTDRGGRAHWDWRAAGSAELHRAAALLRDGMSATDVARALGISRAKGYRLRERAMRDGSLEPRQATEALR